MSVDVSSGFDIQHFDVDSIFTAGKQALHCAVMLDPLFFLISERKYCGISSTERRSHLITRPNASTWSAGRRRGRLGLLRAMCIDLIGR